MGGPAHPPADDPTGVGVNDEGHVDEARPRADIGEGRQPQPVWGGGIGSTRWTSR
jgi:hypothetical protein